MTPEQQKLSEAIRAADALAIKSLSEARHLRNQCEKHLVIATQYGGAVCAICSKSFGWSCGQSPDRVCHYESKDGLVEMLDGAVLPVPKDHDASEETDDMCIFCGQPEERK